MVEVHVTACAVFYLTDGSQWWTPSGIIVTFLWFWHHLKCWDTYLH